MQRNASDIPNLTPYFTVTNADLLIHFLHAVFGATLLRETRHSDNRIQHARVSINGSLIMINDSTYDYPAQQSQMHLYVDNVDETYHAALAQGAVSIMLPNLRPHGDRMAGITDPCGNIWWIASPPNKKPHLSRAGLCKSL
jgi:uncharacterized glyoxalase superfamily protein PhnB